MSLSKLSCLSSPSSYCYQQEQRELESSSYYQEERLSEDERREYWYKHYKQWPPNWHHETEGYKELMEFREYEIMKLTASDERWSNWMQLVQSRMVPRLTSKGIEVIKTPPEVAKILRDTVLDAIKGWDRLPFEVIEDGYNRYNLKSKFVSIPDLVKEVHEYMRGLHESWVGGIELQPTSAYGVRLYQNGSSLVMHLDKPSTHVISSIIHIVHEYDDESNPWSLEIEDHDGKLHSIYLEEGEMLLYESAKCLHGRMHEFRGKYFGSLFLHYKPVNSSIWNYQTNTTQDIRNAIPPYWNQDVIEMYGSRWAGDAITTESRSVFGAPERLVGEDNPRNWE